MSSVWITFHLLLLSVEDIREGELSMAVILELGISGLVYAIYAGSEISPWLGIFLLIFSYCSEERIGYGDSWLILSLGMWLSFEKLVWMFCMGLLSGICWAVGAGRKEVPFVPFLTVGYLLGGLC